MQSQSHARDDCALGQMRVAVAKRHLRARQTKRLAAWRHRLDLINNFLELGTERPRVHEQSAADAAGNPFGKFQTRIAFARRLAHQLRHRAGGAYIDARRIVRLRAIALV